MTKKIIKKDHFGEVLTPVPLVNEMLNSIDEEFWKDSRNKIIDNSCGQGIFLSCIKERLLKYHTEDKIQDMLFGVDIQKDNVEITKRNTGLKNIIEANALEFDCGMKFDLSAGNPPYNNPKNGKKGNVCNPLWKDFVEHAIDKLLNYNGLLLYVHPPLYRKVGHKLWEKMKVGHFQEIHMFSMQKSSDLFQCDTKVDWYLWKNWDLKLTTKVFDEKNNMYSMILHDRPFLPNYDLYKAMTVFNGKRDILYDCKYHHYTHDYMSQEETPEHKYRCIYLINKKGITYYWSSKDVGHFGIPKVIVSMGTGMAILDDKGEYGMCEICFGIPMENKEEGERIVNRINSNEFQEILKACKWKTVQIDYKLFRYLGAI